jgi:GNAT superfamily N-acetyltransferase
MNKRKTKRTNKNIMINRRLSTNNTKDYELFIHELTNELTQCYGNIKLQSIKDGIYSTINMSNKHSIYKADGHLIRLNNVFTLSFHPVEKGINLFNFLVYPLQRNTGIGSKILRIMISISNMYNIPVYLIPIQTTEEVSIEYLREFYHKFGFKRERYNNYWKYSPRIDFKISDIIDSTRVISIIKELEEIQLKAA